MAEKIKVLQDEGRGEITEKKSRFIATLRPVSTVEEATAFIEEMKKKYWDARHNCSAFVIGDNNEISRCSDDGEPSGTAGRPMLETLVGSGIHNVAVVVTRYFGGVLLGTGGLVRAYRDAVKAGIEGSPVMEKIFGIIYDITCDYNSYGKLQYLFGEKGIIPVDTIYEADVVSRVIIPLEDEEAFIKNVTENLNGKATFTKGETAYYTVMEGKTLII
ncbi:MAG: YigZ family protein [Lachnospiraceae bacterium]|nr:YigZ family protein [Lachnospiraceae bacterium]